MSGKIKTGHAIWRDLPPATIEALATDLAAVLVEVDEDLGRKKILRAHLYVVYQRLLAASSFADGESS